MKRHYQKGISIMELLVALVIGTLILSAGISFMLNSSKAMRMGQEQAKYTSQAQQILSRMVKEIKSVNIDAPPLFTVSPAWATLPALPYTSYELSSYPDTSGDVILPAVPAARKFASQAGATDMQHKWYPNPSGNESNSLVFYKAPGPGAGGTSQVQRISYRLVGTRLLREVQSPLSAGSDQFHSNPVPSSTLLSDMVRIIQFTYPLFEQQMTTTLDTTLTAQTEPDRTEFINENCRKVISIRIVMGGLRLGSQDTPSVELKTEVRLRSE
ncbi:MAG: PilW family protein [Candidatus Sericytochromatia bacterium]